MSNYALQVPASLSDFARKVTEDARGQLAAFDEWLAASLASSPLPGDELIEDMSDGAVKKP